MRQKLAVLLLSLVFGFIFTAQVDAERNHEKLDAAKVASLSLFYNPKTNKTLSIPHPAKPGPLARLPFASPCSCSGPKCNCCTGVKIHGFGFDRQVCAELTYLPEEAKLNFHLKMNNNSIYRSKFPAHDQQLCVPVIPISIVGPVEYCVRLHNMNVTDQRLHACLAMHVRMNQYPFLTLQFSCMEMGVGGVMFSRPGSYGPDGPLDIPPEQGISISVGTTTQGSQSDSDVFDDVSETPLTENLTDPREHDVLVKVTRKLIITE